MILIKFIKNKYFLTTIGIIVWLLFFDKNDVFSQMELMGKLNKLRADKTYYLAEIKNNRDAIEDLKTNKKSLERFAREKYLMKKDNEDVYVIVKK
ncbi:MAG TPA: septum formation initiator family protein [Bacteroidia bacterium]|nr:septum formation initiator family protein [Bacteroidia bacterium]HRD36992.1 septum formation initiator family protein [Bacteroidia bacterium]